jgi:ribonuclease HII
MLERSLNPDLAEAGLDEAGRGCLAGPVFAAAVILPKGFSHPDLNDSKKLSERKRKELRKVIETEAKAWAVAEVSPKRIDEINILNASIEAMHLALDQLSGVEFLLVDGNKFKAYRDIEHRCIVKGDGKYMNIAAASILAKTYRDEFMETAHEQFPQYGWLQNKGYPTAQHVEGIRKHGRCELHRESFKLKSDQLQLF